VVHQLLSLDIKTDMNNNACLEQTASAAGIYQYWSENNNQKLFSEHH